MKYEAIKTMFLINELVKEWGECELLPFSEEALKNYNAVCFNEENKLLISDTGLGQIMGYYDSIGYGDCLYEARVFSYEDFFNLSNNEYDEEDINPEMLDEKYIELRPVNQDTVNEYDEDICLYVYKGKIYMDDLDVINEIEDKYYFVNKSNSSTEE